MAKSKKPEDESKKIARLLLKSIESLPEKDRQKVLEYIVAVALQESLAGSSGAGPVLTAAPLVTQRSAPGFHISDELLGAVMKQWRSRPATLRVSRKTLQRMDVEQQMVPVRFSKGLHERLKGWCEENGFSMAVVIRGLVERFLELQGRRAS